MESGWPLGKVWGAEGSMLPAQPGSQCGVNSVALGPPSRVQVRPVVRRLWGVSMEADHPAGRRRGRRVRFSQVIPFHLLPSLARLWVPTSCGTQRAGPSSTPTLTQACLRWTTKRAGDSSLDK